MPTKQRRIAIINQKGGVGKSTTTVNLAVELATLGHRVLVVDFDAQRNTSHFLGSIEAPLWSTSEFILPTGEPTFQPLRDVCVKGLDLVPAHETLTLADRQLLGDLMTGTIRLRRALDRFAADYEYVVIDCGPALGMMAINAVVAAGELIVPVQLGHAALIGAITFQKFVQDINDGLQANTKVLGILPTFLDDREKSPREVLQTVREAFGPLVFETSIHDAAHIRASGGKGKPVVLTDPDCRSALEYKSFTKEVIARG